MFDFERAGRQADSVKRRIQYGRPLSAAGALAALHVVVGNLSLEDAANAVGLAPADLVREAEAWALGNNL
jgi:hypothetical protein